MDLAHRALIVTSMIAAPLLLVALVAGLVIGMLQAATQINEPTLSFIPKLLVLVAHAVRRRTLDAAGADRLHARSVRQHSQRDRLKPPCSRCVINAADVSGLDGAPVVAGLRIGGFVLAAPIASEVAIPGRVKIVLTLALAFLLAPLAPVPAGLSIFSGAGTLAAVQELLIGVAIGMVVQLAFEA